MKQLIIIISSIIIFNGCSSDNSKKLNSLTGIDKDSINFNNYYCPKDSLAEPRVYIYINDSTHKREYHLLETQNSVSGYMLTTTIYDDSFRQKEFEKDSISQTEITILEDSFIDYDSTNKQTAYKLTYSKSFIPSIQLITDTSTYYLESKLSIKGVECKTSLYCHFEKAAPPNSQLCGKDDNCIKQIEEVELTSSEAVQGKKLFTITLANYYAKGIGLIYFEEPDFLSPIVNRFSLEKIITMTEFYKIRRLQ